ncbi:MAG: thioredoxin family protein [Candidatus Bathyarchaeia archaeon]
MGFTVDLQEVRRKTVSIEEYISAIDERFRDKFLARKESYQLNQDAIKRLRDEVDKYTVVVFSADWCKDCVNNVPVLALISESTGLEVRVFGHLKTAPLNPRERWKIPPSPPEVKTFGVKKTPWIVIFDKQGKEIGKIIENPEHADSLEEELLYVIRCS